MINSCTKLSVALVTRNRPAFLNRCLESLRSQSVQPFEIIVSDDSDPEFTDDTETTVKKWNCQYLSGPRRGLQANLNNAALACQGTHVRVINDDHIFPEDHLKITQRLVESDPDSVWIIGEYYEMPEATTELQLPGEVQPRGYHKPISDFDDCFAISGGASIYPRKIFENHRFLESFGYVCDLEFGPRLKGLGYRIRYSPETYVIHLSEGEFLDRFEKHQRVIPKGSFLTAYLTYGCYLKNPLQEFECLSYFSAIALLTSLKIKNYYFNLEDFWQTWRLGVKYKQLFEAGKYDQIV